MLERLIVAASLAARHAGAYVDLVLSDADAARRHVGRQLWAATFMATTLIFATAMGCVLMIAATWDTAARLWTVAALLLLFSTLALIAYLRLRSVSMRQGSLFARTAREWEKDRVLLEQLLSGKAIPPVFGDER